MPIHKLKEFLEHEGVAYIMVPHPPTYTAQTTAQTAHVPGGEVVKTVMLDVDGRISMVALPATRRVDVEAFRRAVGATAVRIVPERDFERVFPGCELGAMPPFGNLWNVPVYVSSELAEHELIAFNAGLHTELVQLAYADFERLVRPTVVSLTNAFV